MATVNHKRTIQAAEVTAFGGIDASSPCGDGGVAADLKNFKVLSDGSLCRRSGFATLTSFEDAVRGAGTFRDAEGSFILVAEGTRLHRISLPDGTVQSADGLFTGEGKVTFFEHGGDVYFLDGTEMYRYTGGTAFEVCQGYVPLYGVDWLGANSNNPVNEPINLLSGKIRIRYATRQTIQTLRFKIKLASVDWAVLGNTPISLYGSTLSEDGAMFSFGTAIDAAAVLTLYATVDMSYYHDAWLRSCTEVASYESFSASRTFLFGGEDPSQIFVSRPVDKASLAAARVAAPNATALYFPKDGAMRLENGLAVTAVDRVGDRMMICSEGQTWVTEELSKVDSTLTVLPVRSLTQTAGSRSVGGLSVIDGEVPVTVSEGGVYRWEIDTNLERRCSFERISDGIAPLLPEGFATRARLHYVRGEDTLWLYDPEDPDGRVFLYDCAAKRWYSYVGIPATRLLETDGRVGFYDDNSISFFDEHRSTDLCTFGEREIVGYYRSRRMDFGDGEAVKRAVRVYAESDLGDGELTVGLADGGLLDEVVFRGDGTGMKSYSAKVTPRRFQRVAVTLRATGGSPQRILGFCVHAR